MHHIYFYILILFRLFSIRFPHLSAFFSHKNGDFSFVRISAVNRGGQGLHTTGTTSSSFERSHTSSNGVTVARDMYCSCSRRLTEHDVCSLYIRAGVARPIWFAYDTRVEAVALSYFQLGGRAFTHL